MIPCSMWMVGALALGLSLTSDGQFEFGQQPMSSSNLDTIPNGRWNGKQSQQGCNRGHQSQQQQEREPFDLDRDVAPIQVVYIMGDAARAAVSPYASDASLVIRITMLVSNAFFDAIAPYTRTTVGIYSNLGRR